MPDLKLPDPGTADIVHQLLADHRSVETGFAHIEAAAADRRASLFAELVPLLVAHEVAEEQIVFPPIRAAFKEAAPIIGARLGEQNEAERSLSEMERLDPSTDGFSAPLMRLRTAVLAHAKHEEQEVFPLVDQHPEAFDRPTMGARYQRAKHAAPTHPHPHAPDSPPGNVILGPVAAIADRVRDALSS